MKKAVLFLTLILSITCSFGQMTKNTDRHVLPNGTEVKKGVEIEVLTGANPSVSGEFLWLFLGTSKPIPQKHLNSTHTGQVLTVDKVMYLKGIKDKNEALIVSFKVGKERIYCFVGQALKYSEIKILQ